MDVESPTHPHCGCVGVYDFHLTRKSQFLFRVLGLQTLNNDLGLPGWFMLFVVNWKTEAGRVSTSQKLGRWWLFPVFFWPGKGAQRAAHISGFILYCAKKSTTQQQLPWWPGRGHSLWKSEVFEKREEFRSNSLVWLPSWLFCIKSWVLNAPLTQLPRLLIA